MKYLDRLTYPSRVPAALICFGFLIAGAGSAQGYEVNNARAPLGVYAHVSLPNAINDVLPAGSKTAACSALPPGVSKSGVQSSLRDLYADLLGDQAISGIVLGVHWCAIQVCPPSDQNCQADNGTDADGNDWSYLDDALSAADSAGKTIQLVVTPGFDSPPWLLARLTSCDDLFPPVSAKAVGPGCGSVTFTAFPEQQRTDSNILPLPWSPAYVKHWADFLQELNQTVQQYPKAFAAIDIAGPVGGSPEMILPTTANKAYSRFCGVSKNGVMKCVKTDADKVWQTLIDNAIKQGDFANFPPPGVPGILHSGYYTQYPDQVFVDLWNAAIDQFETTFSGVTLVLNADSGAKDFPELGMVPVTDTTTIPGILGPDAFDVYASLWPVDCTPTDAALASCQVKAEVIAHFAAEGAPASPTIANLKATNVGGMRAASPEAIGDIGIPGVKVLTAWSFFTANSPPPPPFLGGSEFDFSVTSSNTIQIEGCPHGKSGCSIIPEQAAYNVFANFFNCTAAGASDTGGAFSFETACSQANQNFIRNAPIQFVEMDYADVEYAHGFANTCPAQPITVNGFPSCASMEDLLNGASDALLRAAGQQVHDWSTTCLNGVVFKCQPPPVGGP